MAWYDFITKPVTSAYQKYVAPTVSKITTAAQQAASQVAPTVQRIGTAVQQGAQTTASQLVGNLGTIGNTAARVVQQPTNALQDIYSAAQQRAQNLASLVKTQTGTVSPLAQISKQVNLPTSASQLLSTIRMGAETMGRDVLSNLRTIGGVVKTGVQPTEEQLRNMAALKGYFVGPNASLIGSSLVRGAKETAGALSPIYYGGKVVARRAATALGALQQYPRAVAEDIFRPGGAAAAQPWQATSAVTEKVKSAWEKSIEDQMKMLTAAERYYGMRIGYPKTPDTGELGEGEKEPAEGPEVPEKVAGGGAGLSETDTEGESKQKADGYVGGGLDAFNSQRDQAAETYQQYSFDTAMRQTAERLGISYEEAYRRWMAGDQDVVNAFTEVKSQWDNVALDTDGYPHDPTDYEPSGPYASVINEIISEITGGNDLAREQLMKDYGLADLKAKARILEENIAQVYKLYDDLAVEVKENPNFPQDLKQRRLQWITNEQEAAVQLYQRQLDIVTKYIGDVEQTIATDLSERRTSQSNKLTLLSTLFDQANQETDNDKALFATLVETFSSMGTNIVNLAPGVQQAIYGAFQNKDLARLLGGLDFQDAYDVEQAFRLAQLQGSSGATSSAFTQQITTILPEVQATIDAIVNDSSKTLAVKREALEAVHQYLLSLAGANSAARGQVEAIWDSVMQSYPHIFTTLTSTDSDTKAFNDELSNAIDDIDGGWLGIGKEKAATIEEYYNSLISKYGMFPDFVSQIEGAFRKWRNADGTFHDA